MKLLTKDQPTTDWLSTEIWKVTKLASGFLLAMTLQVSAATETKDSKFFLKLNNAPLTGSNVAGKNSSLSELTKNSGILFTEQKTIKGKVTGPKGEPLPGVNIVIKGTQIGVSTDFDGNFVIDVPDSNTILVISFTGFVTKEVLASNASNIQLEEQNQTLNEVVVVGYGTQKKGSTTGAIASVKGTVLTTNASANVSNAIAGRMSGVIANNRSGRPGDDSSSLLIRGFNSFGGGTSPLVVVDGIPDRDLNRINPDDIESVTVLKDASAAIYGVRSANGVILVTTKRGKVGAPTIKIDGSYGIQQLTRMDERVNSWQYMTYYNELNAHKGTTLPYTQTEIDKYKAGNDPNYTSTNWLKEVYRKDAPQSNVFAFCEWW